MNDSDLLVRVRQDSDKAIQRIRGLVDRASEEDLKRAMGADSWSAIQILEHLTLSHDPYRVAMSALAFPDGDGPVRQTFMGKQIEKALSGRRNVPAPGKLYPSAHPDCSAVVANWETCHNRFQEMLAKLEGKRISEGRFRNPVINLIRLTGADGLAIYSSHLRYHLPQIEARLDMNTG
ncbi:MAG: DinB family protein [Fimbriimonadaceae bacterium]|nr:DinB family protein [Fimbriimonadaceae bacterium]